MEKKWWHQSVVYQIYPRSFNDSNGDGMGDIPGIIDKLDYLATLGIDVIWLSPVYASPMDDNGYDISNYYAIAPEFGTMEDMEQLIDEASKRNIRIIMDLVVNHTSDEHDWFTASKDSRDNPYRDYYIWREGNPDGTPPSSTTSVFGGSAWEYDAKTDSYYFHLFSKKQPDLNWKNENVQDAVFDMMNFWIDKGIGGFRMDVIDLIGKDIDEGITENGPTLHPLIRLMNRKTFGSKDLLTVGETWSANPAIAKLYSAPEREELSMIFQFDHITLSWDEQLGKWGPKPFDLLKLKATFNKWQTELADSGWNSLFWNNHDLPRVVSKYGDTGIYREKSAKMLATVLHLLKGTPYIYQGEEIGMTNVAFPNIEDYQDIESLSHYKQNIANGMTHEAMMHALHENSRDNARTPMQWNDSTYAGFSQHEPWLKVNPNYTDIHVADALERPDSVFYYYKRLIELRKTYPAIVYGTFTLLAPDDPQVFAYLRRDEEQEILIITNFSEAPASLSLDTDVINHYIEADCLIHNQASNELHGFPNPLITRQLAPYDAYVFIRQLDESEDN